MKEENRLLKRKSLNEEEIELILDKNPEYIMFLYRWLNNKELVGDQCEKLCKYLLNSYEIFENIPNELAYASEENKLECGWKYVEYRSHSRKGDAIKPKYDPVLQKSGKHRRNENYLAMEIFKQGRRLDDIKKPQPIKNLGYILDYEMPIGGTKTLLTIREGQKYDKNDKSYPFGLNDPSAKDGLFSPGKCDLISYERDCFTILELKDEDSPEPLLRAVVEAFTYLKMLDTRRAEDSFRNYYGDLIGERRNTRWRAATLLYAYGSQNTEYNCEDNKYLRDLMCRLGITPIWYIIENGVFNVVKEG